MWVLATNGDIFKGKKLWLRPGKKFLFGRTQVEIGGIVISDKTISRKHLTIEVDQVGLADCANPNTRSRITLEDLETKIGTTVNGEQIRGKRYVLEREENAVFIGRYKFPFIIAWIPINHSFLLSGKEEKAGAYTTMRQTFAPLDVKILDSYVSGVTTHVGVKKRNTAKGLQALIDGKYIVQTDTFLKALVDATTPSETTGKSPLEEDWDANFPDPEQFLPARGEEPTERDASAYAPNPWRQSMFEGYTFIFCDPKQFNNLFPALSQGRGKAMLRAVVPNETQVTDFVRYVKEVAGEKGLGEFEDGSEGKGVVVVRFNPSKGQDSGWFPDFNREVSLRLDHRLIEQNEFLDAILGVDASVLRKPLDFIQSGVVAPPATANTVTTSQTLRSSQPASTPTDPPQTGRFRRGASRFKIAIGQISEEPTAVESSIPEVPAVESQSLFVSQGVEMDVGSEAQPRTIRKRPSPPITFDEGDDIMEDLAPTASKLKKRRLAEQATRRGRGNSMPAPPTQPIKVELENSLLKSTKWERVEAEAKVDVVEELQKANERAEELARAEREDVTQLMEGMTFEEIRNLAVIEEYDVRRRPPLARPARADGGDRWDDRWNGRKNFKGFRRQGQPATRGPGRVIIPLVKVKQKEYGVGDNYWTEDGGRKKNNSQSQKSQSRAAQRAAEILAQETEEHRLAQDELNAGLEEDNSSSGVEVVEPPPKAVSKSQKLADKTSASQIMPTGSRKRAAETALTKPAPAKKAKAMAVEADVEDSSDDELKFRFRKKR